ncbi:hypothetical protein [Candidatus Burkholderia verschuerenii]|uniref:hypothetical protein n=1 Tax=Candidatus Burkholderia verschuerenii TaxID=242163 RepID=UPI0012ED7386|nr:hypothetical protein [Candidatus Burkholderia verschuerenii]
MRLRYIDTNNIARRKPRLDRFLRYADIGLRCTSDLLIVNFERSPDRAIHILIDIPTIASSPLCAHAHEAFLCVVDAGSLLGSKA